MHPNVQYNSDSISLYSSVGRAGDCNMNVDIPRSLVRIQLERFRVVWPSGLWRQFKALVSSEARVRISSQTFCFVFLLKK